LTRVLFCSSEVQPFSKTGGLADLAGSLPPALIGLGHDIRIVTPAYRAVIERWGKKARKVATVAFAGGRADILETRLPDTGVPVYLVDEKRAFDRAGGLYLGPDGEDWPDNHIRFSIFSRAIVEIAMDRAGLSWYPQVVHCNDWQTGLVPAMLAMVPERPRTVFTINNLAYQGLFDYAQFSELGLPDSLWSFDAMELNGYFAFIKGGLTYADWLVAVSPSYAEEIKTPEFGCGLDGLLRFRAGRLVGILNGIDENAWDPAKDPLIEARYDADSLELKARNKLALQARLKLDDNPAAILVANIGRLAYQKGTELIAASLPSMMRDLDVQFVMLGTGEMALKRRLEELAGKWPGRAAVVTAFSESLAHQIEAAADMFLMPSLYEPCGLNQMYSMRYGTVPVVRRTGGLKDTVVCAAGSDAASKRATGFCFDVASPGALLRSLRQAIATFRNSPQTWRQIVAAGMGGDFSWRRSAAAYAEIYDRTATPPR
jgi:starch synthase